MNDDIEISGLIYELIKEYIPSPYAMLDGFGYRGEKGYDPKSTDM